MKLAPLMIKDEDTRRIALELSVETLDATVRNALQERLDRLRVQSSTSISTDRMLQVAVRCAARTVLDSRSANEILGYDHSGLPQ